MRRLRPQGAQVLEDTRGGCARIGVQLDYRRVQLGLRAPREVTLLERRDELGAAADLLERACVQDDELFLDAERERRWPLAEPRVDRHYCARTP